MSSKCGSRHFSSLETAQTFLNEDSEKLQTLCARTKCHLAQFFLCNHCTVKHSQKRKPTRKVCRQHKQACSSLPLFSRTNTCPSVERTVVALDLPIDDNLREATARFPCRRAMHRLCLCPCPRPCPRPRPRPRVSVFSTYPKQSTKCQRYRPKTVQK